MNKRMLFNKEYLSGRTQGHGYLRTTKLGVASGIALAGGLVAVGNVATVSADEVATDTTSTVAVAPSTTTASTPSLDYSATQPAASNVLTNTTEATPIAETAPAITYASGADNANTVVAENPSPALNNAEAQPVATKENVTAEKSANQTNGEIRVDVENKEHTDAIAKAKAEGVEVKEQPKQTAASLADAQGKLKTETTAISAATNAYVTAKQNYANATTAYNQAQAANDAVANEANAARAQGLDINIKTQAGTSEQAIAEAKTQIANLQQATKTYKEAIAAYEVSKKNYETAVSANDSVRRKVDEANGKGLKVTTKTEKVAAEAIVAKAQDQIKALDQAIANYEKVLSDFNNKKASSDQLTAVNKQIQDAIDKAKAAGVTVNVKNVTTTAAEAQNGAKATIDAITKATEKYASDKARYESNKQATDTSKATYDKAVASRDAQVNDAKSKGVSVKDATATATSYDEAAKKVTEEQKANEATTTKFEKDKAEAEANTSKEGYLSETVIKNLVMDSEPTAVGQLISSPSNNPKDENAMQAYFIDPATMTSSNDSYRKGGSFAALVNLGTGQSATVKYTNLQNSYYDGKKIGSLNLTVKDVSKLQGVSQIGFYNDFTNGIWYNKFSDGPELVGNSKAYQVTIEAFDTNGKKIQMDDIAASFGSLNSGSLDGQSGTGIEMITIPNGHFVTYNGSSVRPQGRNEYGLSAYSETNNEPHVGTTLDWDKDGAPQEYYGAIGAKMKAVDGNMQFVAAADNRSVWLTINTRFKAATTPYASITKTTYTVDTPNAPAPKATVDATLYNVETPNKPDTPKAEVTLFEADKPTEPKKPKADVTLYNPKKPVAPTSSIDAHSYDVAQKPTITKAVTSQNGTDANGKKVAKGSVVKFDLVTNVEKAGRKPIQKGTYVITDALPSGYQVDLEATKAEKGNSAYNIVSFDQAKNILKVVLNDSETDKYNANLNKDYDTPNFTVVGRVLNDNATYKNTYNLSIGNNYNVVSNTVTVYTPGGEDPNEPDPKNPNNPHGGSNIEPTKINTDKYGNDISGKQLMAGSVANYVGKFDLDQFKGTVENSGQHGFIDQWEKDKLKFNPADAVITTSAKVGEGEKVSSDLFDVITIDDINNIKDQATKDLITRAGIKLDAKYALTIWKAKDSNAFFEKYVKTGTNLYFHMPMTLTKDAIGSDIHNRVDQINFDNGYAGNVVVNHVPKVTPEKDVVVKVGDTENIDGQTIALGQVFNYELKGGTVPAEAIAGLFQYGFKDKLDLEHDQFTGNAVIKLGNDVTLKDGTVVKADDASKYGKSEFKDGVWSFEFDKDFLENLSGKEDFSAKAYLEVKRIAYGDVYNEYVNTINGVEYLSNKVVTHTPEPTPEKPQTPEKPKVPETPAPQPQAPATPATPERKVLPNTGDADSIIPTVVGFATLAGLSAAAIAKRYSKRG